MKKVLSLFFCLYSLSLFAQLNPGLVVKVNGKIIPSANAAFGGVLDLDAPLCGKLVLVSSKGGANPTDNTKLEACDEILNAGDLNGNIALVRRGTCNFNVKAKLVQDAGAIAMIMFDNVANTPPANMTGTDATVTIPVCRITLEDGTALATDLKANKNVQACLIAPSATISDVYGNRYFNTTPKSQGDSLYPLVSIVNRGTDTIKNVTFYAEYTSPSGVKTTISSGTDDIAPTSSGFVNLISFDNFFPTEVGTYNVKFYSKNYREDTLRTQTIVSEYTFANDNGQLTGTGTARTPATFATQFKKYSHLSYYYVSKDTKATFATFGIVNAAQMKNRGFRVSIWESSDEKLDAIGSSVSSVDQVAEFPIGDEVFYTMKGTEKSLITVPLTDGSSKGIQLEKDKVYVLAVEYDGSSYADSIVPQYTLGRNFPIRWPGVAIFGTGVMSGDRYFTGGWNTTEDPVGRLHLDNFVGTEQLASLEEDEVSVFPNPTNGLVNLSLKLKSTPKKVDLGIMDFNGKLIEVISINQQDGVIPVNISHYPAGTYFFTVKTDKAFTTEKVIKQ